jgi:hypothetical protein
LDKNTDKYHVLPKEQLGTTAARLECMPQKTLKQIWKGHVVTEE